MRSAPQERWLEHRETGRYGERGGGKERDFDEATGHRSDGGPRDAKGCVRRVRVLGWAYLYTGASLYTDESYRRGGKPFASVKATGAIVIDNERVGSIHGASSADCVCRGCCPVGIDDGRRPRTRILASDSVGGFTSLHTPRREVLSRVEPGDTETPEPPAAMIPSETPRCVGCHEERSIATMGLCWACLAASRRRERGLVQ